MHRTTPLMTAFRAFSAGGARSIVDKIDDGTLMQEMAGNFMKGETRDKVEAPQNYGFSSVVQAATKGKDGQIGECAEAIINFIGGNRSHPVATMMDDRRFRPLGLKPGENSQYDDIGQMTLMRRTGLFLLSLDGPDTSQQQSSGKDSGGGGSQSQNVERMVSLRHVEKKKQERQQSQAQAKDADGRPLSPEAWAAQTADIKKKNQDFKHEGESVNTEVRLTKGRIEFRVGDAVVGYYDTGGKKWAFVGEVHLGKEDAAHPAYGVSGGAGMTTATSGAGAVLVNATKPGPPTSMDGQPFEARDAAIAALEARVAALEAKR
jgi:hypothetical protein